MSYTYIQLTMASKVPDLGSNYLPAPQRKRGRTESRSPSPQLQPDAVPSKKVHHEFNYTRGLSNRERVDLVLSRLEGEHRWTIKDLIHYAVTEEPEKKYGRTAKKRARDVATAIFDDKEVTDALSRASNNLRDRQALDMAKVFQTEFRCAFLCLRVWNRRRLGMVESINMNHYNAQWAIAKGNF